ncbi:hypothetical protein ILYODFUR_025596 [Ilyodon furcidens]|uniref:Uncharacterized protein n=1 Tax=Ilyodon furcidens TaxID=33524 RepID=A0ABV0U9Q8_9TELE
MVYQYMYSPDGSLHGFVNHTLSYFNVSHFEHGKETMDPMPYGYAVEVCSFLQPGPHQAAGGETVLARW